MNRRIKWMQISHEILAQLFTLKGLSDVTSDAPEDLKVVRVYQDPHMEFKGMFNVYVTSESFEEVPKGVLIPEYQVQFTKHFPKPQLEVVVTGVN